MQRGIEGLGPFLLKLSEVAGKVGAAAGVPMSKLSAKNPTPTDTANRGRDCGLPGRRSGGGQRI